MTTQVQLYNMALSHAGSRATLALPSDTSREGRLCNQWYDNARQIIFMAAPWQATKKNSRLAVLAERDTTAAWVDTDPFPNYLFAYGAPNDMLRPRYTTYFSNFEWGIWNGAARAIFTNEETPILVYTMDQTNVALWEPTLVNAVAFALAAFICTPLTGQREKLSDLVSQAQAAVNDARVIAANSFNSTVPESMPDWISQRGYSGQAPVARYIFPPAEFGLGDFSLAG